MGLQLVGMGLKLIGMGVGTGIFFLWEWDGGGLMSTIVSLFNELLIAIRVIFRMLGPNYHQDHSRT